MYAAVLHLPIMLASRSITLLVLVHIFQDDHRQEQPLHRLFPMADGPAAHKDISTPLHVALRFP
jgi:hypothetical protein